MIFNGGMMLILCRLKLLILLVIVSPRHYRDLNFIVAITITSTIIIPPSVTNSNENRKCTVNLLLYLFQEKLVSRKSMRYSASLE